MPQGTSVPRLSVARSRPWYARFLKREWALGYALLLPVLVVLAVLLAYPLASSFLLSFQNKTVGRPEVHFIGLTNYARLVHDEYFRQAFVNTLVFTVVSISAKLLLGLLTALVLNERFHGRNVARGVILLPWALPTVVTLVIWSWMYNDMFGVLNFILVRVGLLSQPHNWLGDPSTAMASVIAVNVWRGFPFFGLIILAGLQTIPAELHEAARVDGANRWMRFRHITVPGILLVTMIVTLMSTIWTLNDFTIIWVLTKGGPGHVTAVLSTYTFERAFFGTELSYGVTVSMTLVPLLLALIILLVRAIANREREV